MWKTSKNIYCKRENLWRLHADKIVKKQLMQIGEFMASRRRENYKKYYPRNQKNITCRRGNKSASRCETIHKNHDLLIFLSFSFTQGVRTPWVNKKPRKNPGLNILASIVILFKWLIGFGSRCFSLDWDWLLLFFKGWIWFLLGYWFRCYLM